MLWIESTRINTTAYLFIIQMPLIRQMDQEGVLFYDHSSLEIVQTSWSLSIAGYVLSFSAFLSPSGERRKIKSCAGGAAWRDAGESTYRPHWCARSLPHIAATRRRNATSAQLLSALSSGIRVALPAPHNNATTVRLPPPTYYTAHFVNINTVFHLRFFL